MSKSIKVLIGMVILTIILFILNLVVNNNQKILNTDKYIKINSEEIPSIYNSLGEKTITNINKGSDKTGDYIEISYNNLQITELVKYITELSNLSYVLIDTNENSAVVAKESSSAGKIITISINYSDGNTVIKYSRGAGTLTKN